MSWDRNERIGGRFNNLYRDRDNGMIFGVCAGIAHYFDINVVAARLGAVIGLLVAFVPTAIIYVLATLLLKERSLGRRESRRERDFWRSGSDYGS